MEVTNQLAQFVVNHSYSGISPDIRELAKLTIIDTLGCCIAGYVEAREECEWIVELVRELGGKSDSSGYGYSGIDIVVTTVKKGRFQGILCFKFNRPHNGFFSKWPEGSRVHNVIDSIHAKSHLMIITGVPSVFRIRLILVYRISHLR